MNCKDCNKELRRGRKDRVRCITCSGKYKSGERNPFWKGGKTAEVRIIRASTEYKAWAKAIKERDDYTCQICKVRGGVLHSDHIKPFSLFPELRFDLANGRTLCKGCHQEHGWQLFKRDNPRHKRKNNTPSLSTKEKIRLSNLGQKRSDETKTKQSQIKKDYYTTHKSKSGINIMCLNNNKIYLSHADASTKLGIGRNGITRQVNGILKQTGGYQFQKLTAEHLIF